MYNTACTHADIYTDVNRLVDNSKLLLLSLEDATVVKYRSIKNMPLKILCPNVFMLETGWMFFSQLEAQAPLLSRYL